MRYEFLALFIPLGLGAQVAAVPAPPPVPASDLATVEGQVLNATGGTPLRKANITLNRVNVGPNSQGTRNNYSASTDASGHYSIGGVEPGTYRLRANHTGYLDMEYNARKPGSSGTALEIGRGQKKTGVDFRLTPHGVITGKVTDEDGDPLERVQVQVLRVMYNQGRKQLTSSGGDSTNDLGDYRLSGITPGKYYVSATYRRQQAMFMPGMAGDGSAQEASQEDYVTTFYPGVTDISAASPIELGPGDQAQGVNLKLTKIHTFRVSGHAVDTTSPQVLAPEGGGRGGDIGVLTGPNGQVISAPMMPLNNTRIQVRLQPRNSLVPMGLNMMNSVTRPDGTFEFQSVAPGSYYLVATNTQGGRGGHTAIQPLEVGSNNVDGVTIAITPGATVTGHVRYDGDPPSPLPSLAVRLMLRDNLSMGMVPPPPPAKVDGEGNFRFDDVNLETFNVSINTPSSLYLKSVRSGTTDILLSGLDVSNGAATLDILMGTNPPQVSGSVVNADTEQPAPAVTVVLMPREKERQGQGYFYSSTNTDQNGNFSFTRVTPGEYDVYAWEDAQYGQWFDPDWMKAYEGKGESVEAKEASPVNVKLTMIPAK